MSTEHISIIVDADACPRGAMDVLRQLQKQYGYHLITVASFHHNIGGSTGTDSTERDPTSRNTGPLSGTSTDEQPTLEPAWEHVTVGDGPDEADLAVANRTRAGDIVVTQDWGLAALVLGKGARCLSPRGHEYTPDRIEFQLDERHLKAKHRRGGGRTKGPRARTQADNERFEKTLRRLLQAGYE